MCLGVPGKIVSVLEGDLRMGKVAFGGIRKEVCLAYVPDAGVGDWVVVHVGFAISQLDEAEAERTLAFLSELGDLEALGELDASGSAPEVGEGGT